MGQEKSKNFIQRMMEQKRKIAIILLIAVTVGIIIGLLGPAMEFWTKLRIKLMSRRVENYTHNVTINSDGSVSTKTSAKEIWDELMKNGYDMDSLLSGPEELEYLMNAELVTQLPYMGVTSVNDMSINGTSDIAFLLDAINKTKNGPNCSRWVYDVFCNAGIVVKNPGSKGARGFYEKWCHSSNINDIRPGMIIAVDNTRRF